MAITSPAAGVAAVKGRLRDASARAPRLDDESYDLAIQAAVKEYSRDRPREAVIDITGDGTPFIATSGLTGWVDDWSNVRRIEYPAAAVSASHRPQFLDPSSDWSIYRTAAAWYLHLLKATPAATETVRVTYTVPRVYTEVADTVTDTILTEDKEAVLHLAAAYACDVMATLAAGSGDPAIAADIVNYRDQQQRFSDQAKSWRARYAAHIGKGGGADGGGGSDVRAAAILRDVDTLGFKSNGSQGRAWLTHGGRR